MRIRPAAALCRGMTSPSSRVWTAEEATPFLRAVDDHPHRALYHVSLATGMRRRELPVLSWDDVNAKGIVTVRYGLARVGERCERNTPKTRRSRTLSIDEGTLAQLERHRLWEASKGREPHYTEAWRLMFTDDHGRQMGADHVTRDSVVSFASPDFPLSGSTICATRRQHRSWLCGIPLYVVGARLGSLPRRPSSTTRTSCRQPTWLPRRPSPPSSRATA